MGARVVPWRWWRRLHLLAFPLFALACAHTALAGTDTTSPIVHWAGLLVGAAILFLAVLRMLTGGLHTVGLLTTRRTEPQPSALAAHVPQQRQSSPSPPVPDRTRG